MSHVTTAACAVDSSILVNSLAIWAAHNLLSRLCLCGDEYISVDLVYHSKSLYRGTVFGDIYQHRRFYAVALIVRKNHHGNIPASYSKTVLELTLRIYSHRGQ